MSSVSSPTVVLGVTDAVSLGLGRRHPEHGSRRGWRVQAGKNRVPHVEHKEVGCNYRLSKTLAALGRAKSAQLDGIGQWRRWRERYRALFAEQSGGHTFSDDSDTSDNCWLAVIDVDPTECVWTAAQLAAALSAEGSGTRPIWKPMHLEPFERNLMSPSGSAMTDMPFKHIEVYVRGAIHRWAP